MKHYCITLHCIQEKQEQLRDKRALILQKNDKLSSQTNSHDTRDSESDQDDKKGWVGENEEQDGDIVEDMMILNEEVQELEATIQRNQHQLQELSKLRMGSLYSFG